MIQKLKASATIPHAFQDETHGKNVRVINPIKSKVKDMPEWRDTVTGKNITKGDFDRE